MSKENRKLRKPIWVNFAVLALLLVTSGFIVTACQLPKQEGESTQQQEKTQPAKADQQKQSPKSDRQKPQKPQDNGEDTQDDDDPE
jgi:hypothetical protein